MTTHIIDGENVYRHEFARVCPENGEKIAYELEITTERETIKVEDIEAACAGDGDPTYHEVLASRLIEEFPGRHRLTARHGETEIVTYRNRVPIVTFDSARQHSSFPF